MEGFLGSFPFPTLGITQVRHLAGGNSTPGQVFLGDYEEETVAHEVAHQWIGGSVGTATSRDVWLREGIPEYLAYAWVAVRAGADLEERMQSIHNSLGARTRALLAVAGPADRSDDATYFQGALAIHVLRVLMGEERFRAGLISFSEAYAGKSATTEEFLASMQQHTNVPLKEALRPWIDQEEVPPLPTTTVGT